MLTKSELQWLEDREIQAKEDKGQYYCWYCKYHGYCDPLTLCPTGSSESFYRDAAEFEAKCARLHADAYVSYLSENSSCKPCSVKEMPHCFGDEPLNKAQNKRRVRKFIKLSRLSVEEDERIAKLFDTKPEY